MTAKIKTSPRRHPHVSRGALFFCIISAFSLIMILKNSQIAIAYMQTGLRLCATSVIPSLFPFMVISELLVASGFGNFFGKLLGAPIGKIFGVSGEASTALLLGTVCGFPVGAKTAISLYDRGRISKQEAERLMIFCNIPSSGFLISAVGVSLYSSHRFGVFLLVSALFSSLLTGLIARFLHPRPIHQGANSAPLSLPAIGVATFTSAIAAATASVLSVCACVVFFTSIIGCLAHTLGATSFSPVLEALLFSIFEISSGIGAAASVESAVTSAALCGFAVGWSGLSVHFQILSLGADRGISFTPYFASKLLQGILCAIAALLYVKYVDPCLMGSAPNSPVLSQATGTVPYMISACVLFLICLIPYCKRKRKK